MERLLWIAMLSLVLLALLMLPASSFAAAKSLQPVRSDHPRLIFTPDNTEQLAALLRANPLWPAVGGRAMTAWTTDALTVQGSRTLLDVAFSYRVTGFNMLKERGVTFLSNAVERVIAGSYNMGDDDQSHSIVLMNLALAYDWLYEFLPADVQKNGATALMQLVDYGERNYSYNYQEGVICAFNNHASQAIAASGLAGLAAAGEHPAALAHAEWARRQWIEHFFPVLQFIVGDQGIWNEGTHYNMVMLKPLFQLMDGIRSATGEDLYQGEGWVGAASYYWPYLEQPNGSMVMLGDWWYDPNRQPNLYSNLYSRILAPIAKAATETKDPYLQGYAQQLLEWKTDTQIDLWHVLWYNPALPAKPLTELPPSRIFHSNAPQGGEELAVLRSGWGADARVLTLAGGDWFSHHDHYNAAAFTAFYKGDLAIDPGYDGESQRDWQFFRRSIAHNTIVVDAPGAGGNLVNHAWGFDGGQRVTILDERPRSMEQYFRLKNPEYPTESLFETGNFAATTLTNTYDYVAVDAKQAYEKAQLKAFTRHMVFLKPDVVVIYDYILTPAGNTPRWLLQSVQQPQTNENTVLVKNGGGELHLQVLLPSAPQIQTFPSPAGMRTEVVSPAGEEHRFVVVMHLTDNGVENHPQAHIDRNGDKLTVTLSGASIATAAGEVSLDFRWDGQPGVTIFNSTSK